MTFTLRNKLLFKGKRALIFIKSYVICAFKSYSLFIYYKMSFSLISKERSLTLEKILLQVTFFQTCECSQVEEEFGIFEYEQKRPAGYESRIPVRASRNVQLEKKKFVTLHEELN